MTFPFFSLQKFMCRKSRVNRRVVMVEKSSSSAAAAATAVAQKPWVGLATSSKVFHNFSQSGPPPVLNNLCHDICHTIQTWCRNQLPKFHF
jgi:hypothetical protein